MQESIVALPTRDGSVQMAEAHRMRTPSRATTKRAEGRALVHGVLLDQYRRRLEYWLTKDDISPLHPVHKVSEMTRYPARDKQGRLLGRGRGKQNEFSQDGHPGR